MNHRRFFSILLVYHSTAPLSRKIEKTLPFFPMPEIKIIYERRSPMNGSKKNKYLLLSAALFAFAVLTVFALNTGVTFAMKTGSESSGARNSSAVSTTLKEENTDSKESSVKGGAQSQPDRNELRLEQLESAVSPQSPLEAAQTWAKAAEIRNGALRYAILSPELRKKQYADYSELNWVIGNSSPWVQDYKVTEKSKNDVYTYLISYNLTDSTAQVYKTTEEVSVQKIEQQGIEKWVVVSGKNSEYFAPGFPVK
jgi:hypothetical protein